MWFFFFSTEIELIAVWDRKDKCSVIRFQGFSDHKHGCLRFWHLQDPCSQKPLLCVWKRWLSGRQCYYEKHKTNTSRYLSKRLWQESRSPALQSEWPPLAAFSNAVPKAVPVLVSRQQMALTWSPKDPGRVTVGREGARMAHLWLMWTPTAFQLF